jgi:sortase A
MSLSRILRFTQVTLMLGGLGALGYVGYVYADSAFYQAYQNWAFDEQLHGRTATVGAFLADATPLMQLLRRPVVVGEREDAKRASDSVSTGSTAHSGSASISRSRAVVERAIVGRIELPRLGVRAMVREGVDERTLRRAVGHIPATALPGQDGNIGLAGHRDSFFRQLRNVHTNDRIALRTLNGEYDYVVDSITVVMPDDMQVLAPTAGNVLTLVTCYPFNYVGHAPRRYIVRARQVSDPARAGKASGDADTAAGAP